jgi:type IV pilus assembly protein PilC
LPSFAYVAKDSTGNTVEGSRQAENQQVLVRQLKAEGYWVTSVKQEKGAAPAEQRAKAGGGFSLFKRVKLNDLAVFCRQFATMINAGVSLVRCLDVLEQQTGSLALKEIIRDIQSEVEGGATLSRSMGKYPRVFSNLAIGLVRAGEVGGVLDETLERLAIFMEKDVELRRKVKASMTYPIIVMIVALGIVLFLCTFIVPKFIALFEELGMTADQFPLPTLMLKRFSEFVLHYWWLVIAIVVVLWLVISRLKRTKTGKRYYDVLKLKVPVFGKLNHKIAVARFSRTLSTLLTSGVPILQAMETVAAAIDNDLVGDAVLLSRSAVREGETIGEPLAQSRMFPPMVVQMISIGEETGQLDDMLGKVADFYEAEVDATLQSLTAAIEPLMIVLLGAVVGFIVFAMFLPLINVISTLSQN